MTITTMPPGPGDYWHQEPHWQGSREQDIAERAGELYDEYRRDPAKVAEADEDVAGLRPGEHYDALESALADLGEVSAERLIGSDALARVLRLAAVHAEARRARLLEMAREQAEREFAPPDEPWPHPL